AIGIWPKRSTARIANALSPVSQTCAGLLTAVSVRRRTHAGIRCQRAPCRASRGGGSWAAPCAGNKFAHCRVGRHPRRGSDTRGYRFCRAGGLASQIVPFVPLAGNIIKRVERPVELDPVPDEAAVDALWPGHPAVVDHLVKLCHANADIFCS